MKKQQKYDESSSDDYEDALQVNILREEDRESVNESLHSITSINKRGRKKIPEKWSWVISLSTDDLSNLKVFELAPDLLLGNAMIGTLSRGKK